LAKAIIAAPCLIEFSEKHMDQSLSLEATRTALEAPSDFAIRVPYYCEENVWRLAHRHSSSNCHVVFISNARQCVAMHHQWVHVDGPCFWDYHVILIKTENDETVVLDMDSSLSYPCPLQEYLQKSFVQEGDYAPLFR
jgi:N-terminal glutamine amidase